MRTRPPSSRLAACASLVVAACAVPAAAAGERERLRLTYAAPGDAGCPDEASFRNLIAARLGYDPFVPDSPDVVSVSLQRDRRTLRGRAEVARPGEPPTERELSARQDECQALVAALATTLAIALDPVRAAAAQAPAAPAPLSPTASPALAAAPPAPAPPPPETALPPQPAAPPTPVTFFGFAGGIVSIEEAPSAMMGGEAGAGLRIHALSVEVSARAESTLGAVRADSGDRVQVTILSGALAPCAHLGAWSGCAVGRLGALQGVAPDVTTPSLGTTVYASVGVRIGYTIALSRTLSLRPTLEGAIPLQRTQLLIGGSPVWTAGPAAASAGLAVSADFL